ncbi:hypothetical protein JTE90_021049 [Oedothorax gibbosus]|uniref:Uncharacterized protein n=1 Tax=Oedothorax gibbosus TaxID=931172 RepID=A0AAV6VTF8_9ARAC|nr:hypothetical protein JTE90_021049 [Oedothorax gibbosus]
MPFKTAAPTHIPAERKTCVLPYSQTELNKISNMRQKIASKQGSALPHLPASPGISDLPHPRLEIFLIDYRERVLGNKSSAASGLGIVLYISVLFY